MQREGGQDRPARKKLAGPGRANCDSAVGSSGEGSLRGVVIGGLGDCYYSGMQSTVTMLSAGCTHMLRERRDSQWREVGGMAGGGMVRVCSLQLS